MWKNEDDIVSGCRKTRVEIGREKKGQMKSYFDDMFRILQIQLRFDLNLVINHKFSVIFVYFTVKEKYKSKIVGIYCRYC